MRRDWLTWGILAFALGALLVWAVPDGYDDDAQRSARDEGASGPSDTTTDNASWGDWLGSLAMLLGLGLALAGLFKDSDAERAAVRKADSTDEERVGYDYQAHRRK